MGFYFLGRKDTERAAKEQARATRDAALLAQGDNLAAVQANQNQIEAAQAQRIAAQNAADLLGKPMESASVDLASTDEEDDGDLLTRKRSTRSKYRNTSEGTGKAGVKLI